MRLLNNMLFRWKLTLLTGASLLLILLVGYGGLSSVRAANEEARAIIHNEVHPAQAVGQIRSATGSLRAAYLEILTLSAMATIDGSEIEIRAQEKIVREALASLMGTHPDGEKAEIIHAFEQEWERYLELASQVWNQHAAGGITGISRHTLGDVDSSLRVQDGLMSRLSRVTNKDVEATEVALAANERLSLSLGVGSILGAAVVLWLLSLTIRRSMVGPMTRVTDLARQIGEGNLTGIPEPTSRNDEVGLLQNSVIQMAQNMRQLLTEVGESTSAVDQAADAMLINAEEVSRAAGQLAEAIQQVAVGAGGQNESVQEAAHTMEQMRAAIDQVTRGAQEQAVHVGETNRVTAQAAKVVQAMAERVESLMAAALEARSSADGGIAVVSRAVSSMERLQGRVETSAEMVQALEAESRQIGQAVTLITEIADQTNLLALNAAIEAARAGESGRGFAVVADEVRKLAERAARSAGEITELIRSVERRTTAVAAAMREGRNEAQEGSALTADAGRALQAIVTTVMTTVQDMESLRQASESVNAATRSAAAAVDQIAEVVEENTATTEEMAASSDQVGASVRVIADVAQETAATAQEVSASVEELSSTTEHVAETARRLAEVSEQLQRQVARFRV